MSKKHNKKNDIELEISKKSLIKAIWIIGGIVVVVLLGFQFFSNSNTSSAQTNTNTAPSVVNTDGKQIVEMTAGFSGYQPGTLEIKGGTPTILRVKSNNNFGCGSAFRIPKLNISKNLPSSGTTDIDLGTLSAGSTFDGMCAMGMYRIKFKVV